MTENRLHPLIESHSHEVRELCQRLNVSELRVFGSAVGDTFDPEQSDADFVVEFFDPEQPGISDRYLSLAEGLEHILKRPVDLVTRGSIKNPEFHSIIEKTSLPLYAA